MGQDLFSWFTMPGRFSLVSFLAGIINSMKIYGFPSNGNFVDIGTLKDCVAAQVLLLEWVIT